MVKNHKFLKSVHVAFWAVFFYMLKYICERYDKVFEKIDTFFPSSQMWHKCGYKNEEVKDLSVRESY